MADFLILCPLNPLDIYLPQATVFSSTATVQFLKSGNVKTTDTTILPSLCSQRPLPLLLFFPWCWVQPRAALCMPLSHLFSLLYLEHFPTFLCFPSCGPFEAARPAVLWEAPSAPAVLGLPDVPSCLDSGHVAPAFLGEQLPAKSKSHPGGAAG